MYHSDRCSARFVLLSVNMVYADPVTKHQAQKAARNGWIRHEGRPLKTAIAPDVRNIETYKDDDGSSLYYVVNFNPTGFVIMSADDLIEPVIAFAERAHIPHQSSHPLGAMVSGDVRNRMEYVKNSKLERSSSGAYRDEVLNKAKSKWDALLMDSADQGSEMRLSSVATVRVSPLLGSTWDQSTVSGNNVYNYWTPNNYVCGCVATATAQLIRYHSWPTTGIGVIGFTIYVNGASQTAYTHGGDNAGGAYVWGSMPLSPNPGTLTERQQIGYLTADAGYAVNMDYASSGSGQIL